MSNFRKAFVESCKCARDGAGGAAVSHMGCIVLPLAAGAFGASLSGTFLMATMFVASPLIAVGATYALDQMRGQISSVPKLLGSAAVALVVAFGIHSVLGHDHHGDHHNHHGHNLIMSEEDILKTLESGICSYESVEEGTIYVAPR